METECKTKVVFTHRSKALLQVRVDCQAIQELRKNTPHNNICSIQALTAVCIGDKGTWFEIAGRGVKNG